jgi:hypothetical protein
MAEDARSKLEAEMAAFVLGLCGRPPGVVGQVIDKPTGNVYWCVGVDAADVTAWCDAKVNELNAARATIPAAG